MLDVYKTIDEVPVLDLALPRSVTGVHQIELTSRCNLRCPYCPHPTMARSKLDMTPSILDRTLDHVEALLPANGVARDLNLAGIGETTIHTALGTVLEMIRKRLGSRVNLLLATNGVAVDDRMADLLHDHKVLCWVSLHRPEKAGPAMRRLGARGILVGASLDPALSADDWAGQVDWYCCQPYVSPCMWIREGKVMVTADGKVTTCCLDGTGQGVIGDVHDEVGSLETQPYVLCKTCQQEIAVRGYSQRGVGSA